MSTYKRVTDEYKISSIDLGSNQDISNLSIYDNVVITTDTVIINGNLDVVGNITYIDSTELSIQDPFILLNVSNTPSNVSSYYSNSGIITHKTSSTYAGLRYNNTTTQWEISTGTDPTGTSGTWDAIGTATAGSVGGPLYAVQYHDTGNVFGGSAYFSVDYGNNSVTVDGKIVYGNRGTTPAAVANSVTVYNKAEGSGGTGLYVKSTTADDELISKSRALILSIIF